MNTSHKKEKCYARTVKVRLKYPAGKNTTPYGLVVTKNKEEYPTETILDIAAFRPDVKDYIKGTQQEEVVLICERATYTNEESMIPRYMLYHDTLFTNVRNVK